MQWFVVFVNYLANFLPNLSIICEPLRKLTCKGASWTWQLKQELARKKIKQLVTAVPFLQFYNITKEVTIQYDASSSGLGRVLMQDGHPTAYASKALKYLIYCLSSSPCMGGEAPRRYNRELWISMGTLTFHNSAFCDAFW